MIKFNNGILMAKLVLDNLNLLLQNQDIKKDYYVECYQNGREHGFLIMNYNDLFNKTIYITKQRNSDTLVLYLGTYSDRGLSKDAYQNAIGFNQGEELKAAQYIMENL